MINFVNLFYYLVFFFFMGFIVPFDTIYVSTILF